MTQREIFFVPDPQTFVNAAEQKKEAVTESPLERIKATLFLWIAHYSAGTSLEELEGMFWGELYPALLEWQTAEQRSPFDLSQPDQYFIALWLIAFARLYELEPETFTEIVETLDANGQDALYDCLATGQTHPANDTPLLYPSVYAPLLEALAQKHPLQQRNALNSFLRKFYEGQQLTSWGGLHEKSNAGFFGYWSFELAALVKLFGLDDRPFADHIYYPRDLTGAPLLRSWLETGKGRYDRDQAKKLEQAWQIKADEQAQTIEDTFEKAKLSLRSFVEENIKAGSDPQAAKKAARNVKEANQSFTYVSDLLGLDPKELENHPEMAQSFILDLIRSISATAKNIDDTMIRENQALREAMEKQAGEMATEAEIDFEALRQDLPPDIREKLGNPNADELRTLYKDRMHNFSHALDSLVQEEDIAPDDLVTALEKLAVDFGLTEPEPSIAEEVGKNFDKKWKKLREGKKMIDFTFDDLFPKKKD